MPLYALNEENYVYAPDACKKNAYRCIGCNGPLKLKRGKNRIPHFYHVQMTPSCRLYSKNEDHLIFQLQIQKLLSPEQIQIEVPFTAIHRIADLVWEKEKIIFEIQCSAIQIEEAKARVKDYRKIGYEITWLLDDRLFNRRRIRPAEFFLRGHSCYFFHFQRDFLGSIYDQLEISSENRRIKKGKRLSIDLKSPHKTPSITWPCFLPQQITTRIAKCNYYFHGDLVQKALQSATSTFLQDLLTRWKKTEPRGLKKRGDALQFFFKKYIEKPYIKCLEKLLEKFP